MLHFRRDAIEAVGGWDPYNVTEDADLGLRLVRYGYRAGMISLPTLEDAPDGVMIWLRQRTRWFKGWAKTWLVHMRTPGRLLAEVGLGSFLTAQILFLGMLVSSLFHPFLLVSGVIMLWRVRHEGFDGPMEAAILGVVLINVVVSYIAFLGLAWRSLSPAGRKGFWKAVLFVPAYWLLMSIAAWRAAWQLHASPHQWEKTPHKRRWRAAPVQRISGRSLQPSETLVPLQ